MSVDRDRSGGFAVVKKAFDDREEELREPKSTCTDDYAHQVKLSIEEKGKEAPYKQEVQQALKTMRRENQPTKPRFVLRKAL